DGDPAHGTPLPGAARCREWQAAFLVAAAAGGDNKACVPAVSRLISPSARGDRREGGFRTPSAWGREAGTQVDGAEAEEASWQRAGAGASSADAPERPARTWVSAAVLLALTTLAFAPTFGAEFIKWDDQFYVEENPLLLDTGGLRKIWNPV